MPFINICTDSKMSTMPIIRSRAIVPRSPSKYRNLCASNSKPPEIAHATTTAPA